ncbi:MAG: hypothetical protein HY231_16200 [Acidobacteria bacterium]|nr:hypothetical protein [Acidobacteriota bacterium]
MKNTPKAIIALALLATLINCGNRLGRSGDPAQSATPKTSNSNRATQSANTETPIKNTGRVIHVLVALCDNINQGIVPVPARLGNGEDLQNNLYWGAAYGVKTFFSNSKDWQRIAQIANPRPAILERCVFKHKTADVYLIADAYRGAEIRRTLADFFAYASGAQGENLRLNDVALRLGGGADLIAYVGHNGLMDFQLANYPKAQDDKRRDAMMLCCASKNYFAAPLKLTGANPLLWTTNLMAPEAYILHTAVAGWVLKESGEPIRQRAAQAYHQYQKCGLKAAGNLFATSW